MLVLGTTGHVDHGKSALLRLLTGQEPDRLPEEKRTGMTVDLNFLSFESASRGRVGIVDVPGHRRFVRNMISGVLNIDAFIFVVAADDGWMPQSEEHLRVIHYMGIAHGFIVISKVDLVDKERAEQVRADVAKRIEDRLGRPFESCLFSTQDESSLKGVKEGIERLIEAMPPARLSGSARVWIDRVFQPKGMGTVVTGTLREGSLSEGMTTTLFPGAHAVQVKSLQAYHEATQKADPVSRLAIQLSKTPKEGVTRGMFIESTRQLEPTTLVDAWVRSEQAFEKKAKHLSVHCGTHRQLARIIALGQANSGEGQFVRMKFAEPAFLRVGERVLLRAEETVGGAVIVDDRPLERHHSRSLEKLRAWKHGVEGSVAYALKSRGCVNYERFWQASVYSADEVRDSLKNLGALALTETIYGDKEAVEYCLKDMRRALAKAHESKKLGLSEKELLGSISKRPSELLFSACLQYAVQQKEFALGEKGYRLSSFDQVALDPKDEALLKTLRQAIESQEPQPLSLKDLGSGAGAVKKLLKRVAAQGEFVTLDGDHVMAAKTYQGLQAQVRSHLESSGEATTSDLKKLLNTSRKYAVLLLERMDRDRVTFLKGGVRRLLK